jgi:cell division protein ZapA (FtsZ GTPase activity inhibitor)
LNTDSAGSPESVKIDLLGREYDVTGYGNSKEVQKVAAFISQRAESIRKKTSAASTLDLLVLTLLNITDEMLQHKHAQEVTIKKLEEKTDRLLKAIDRIV